MPRIKKYYVDLPKLILYDALDKLMFGYVMGIQDGMPSLSLKRSMEMFMDKYNLNEDNYPLEQGLHTWYKMFESYRDFRKT